MGKEHRATSIPPSRLTRSGKEGGETEIPKNGHLKCPLCPKRRQGFKNKAAYNFHMKVEHFSRTAQANGQVGHALANPAADPIPNTSKAAQTWVSSMVPIDISDSDTDTALIAPSPRKKSVITDPQIVTTSSDDSEGEDNETSPNYSPMSLRGTTPPVSTLNKAVTASSVPVVATPPPQLPGPSSACQPPPPAEPGSSSVSQPAGEVPSCESDGEEAESVRKITPEEAKKDVDLYMCSLCPVRLKNHSQLQMHIEMHQKKRPFKCMQCVWAYDSELKLMEHAMRDHGVEPLFQCQKCQQKYRREAPFRKHRCPKRRLP